ncbi:hypothetical protein FC19_GL000743 [Liquorilactobacillus aquaticus DSM 21051]|uniref:Uncharacterized protein n=1 Tax=Liquorilactobacillus aquaticus DSM 21051 TaxID=1423725 RepID=A0A0R2D8S7_9LACO|nr:hypothetical protein FC19_GL000743 [Liquorilactobacillus aquaticus DSM 21051]
MPQKIVGPHLLSDIVAMWQSLPLPSEYKNGNNILLEENFYILEEEPLQTDKLVLNLIRNYRTSKGKKITELSLELWYKRRMSAKVVLTMMTEVDWNEGLFNNYEQNG